MKERPPLTRRKKEHRTRGERVRKRDNVKLDGLRRVTRNGAHF